MSGRITSSGGGSMFGDGRSMFASRTFMVARRAMAFGAALSIGCAPAEDGGAGSEPDSGDGDAETFVAPRDQDVLLADLRWEDGGLPTIGTPVNLTQRPGYDDQPYFVPDGSGLWYTAVDEHDGQADIWRYDFQPVMVSRITQSNPESEYSATPLPDGRGISAIRVEADSTQRLWRFDADGSNEGVVLPDVAPVGYHAWSGEHTVAMFVLGDPPTLQRGDLRTGRVRVVAEDIGRSMHSIPGTSDVSYVQRQGTESSTIMRLPADGSPPVPIVDAVDGGDFHAWAPDGTLLMASGAVIYALAPEAEEWVPIADFTELRISIGRLAVSPDASLIAMVGEVAALDGFTSN